MPVTFGAGATTAVQDNPWNLSTADLNGDGKADLVVANFSSLSLSVLLGNGDGSFRPAVNYTTGSNPISTALADITGDGKLDLIVGQGVNAQYRAGNGDGTFQAETTIANSGGNNYWIRAADLDRDGKIDLVSGGNGSGGVRVQYGNGNGTFSNVTSYAVPNTSRDLSLGDFNGDGRLDIVSSNGSNNTVSVLLSNRARSYTSAQTLTVGSIPYDVATGDFNGDGKLDLVAANTGGSSYSVLLGDGAGNFGAAQSTNLAALPNEVSVADVNGDGKLDLIFAFLNASQVSIALGNGDGTFQAEQILTTSSRTYDAIAVDLNGDGSLDIAATNYSTSSISTFLQPLRVIPTPIVDDGTTSTTNAAGGSNVTTTNPTALANSATSGIDTAYYSGTQALTLPNGFENAWLSGQGNAQIQGNSGNNAFVIASGSWTIDGRGGTDVVVFATQARAHTFQLIDANNIVVTGPEGTQRLANISGLGFTDSQITFDFSGTAAQVVRLYDAAFNRQADIAGGTNALGQLQAGANLGAIAQGFLNSAEGQTQYASTLTNRQFVDKLYVNVLNRAADGGGAAAWTAALDAGQVSRGAALAAFSESSEHVGFVGVNYVVGLIVDHPLAG